jgi:flagellar biosynthesis/type III secretory pathway protein FliH
MEKLEEIFYILNKLSNKSKASEYLEVILRYLSSSIPKDQEQTLYNEVVKAIKGGNNIMITIADKWMQQGIEKGIEQGIEKGIEKGFERGLEQGVEHGIELKTIQTAVRMIEKNMTNTVIHEITGLTIKKIEDLRKKHKKK